MTRTVIAYYSRTGTAARVAEQLQALTHWPCTEVYDLKPREGLLGDLRCAIDSLLMRRVAYDTRGAELGGCTHLIAIAPIWLGQMASPMRSLLHDLFDDGRQTGIERVTLISVMGGKGAFHAADETQAIVGEPPRPVLALRQYEILDGSCLASLLALKESVIAEQQVSGQTLRKAWLSPEAS